MLGWPLGLLVAVGACVGAERTLGAAVAIGALVGFDGHDVSVATRVGAGLLDTGPATEAEVVEAHGTILGGELRAVDLSIGEIFIKPRWLVGPWGPIVAVIVSSGGKLDRLGVRRLVGLRLLVLHGSFGLRFGMDIFRLWLRRCLVLWRLLGLRVRLGVAQDGSDAAALGPDESAIGDALLDIGGGDWVTVEFVDDHGLWFRLGSRRTFVELLMALVGLGGHEAGARQKDGDRILETHLGEWLRVEFSRSLGAWMAISSQMRMGTRRACSQGLDDDVETVRSW